MIPLFKVFMAKEVSTKLEPVLLSGYITQGQKVEEYEIALKRWFNYYPYILSLNSATSGLTLALRLLNLQPGDEVLCTPLTCTATNWPVLANHLRIKWVDVDPETCNMDLKDLERKITDTTKAILFVHWGGCPIDMNKINTIRDTYNIPVIEDCAHAFGAKFGGKYIGTHGNIAVFSTQAIKHLTTGDGGLIFLPNQELYYRAKLLRWYGISREKRSGVGSKGDFRMEPDVVEWGYKFHMNDINATIGLTNLPYIQNHINHAQRIAEYYDEVIYNLDNISSLETSYSSSYWLYTIKVPKKPLFIKYMKKYGIMVSQVHNRNDTHSCVEEFMTPLPQLDQLEKEIVCIPCGWWVSMDECETIVKRLEWWDTNYKEYDDFVARPLQPTDVSYIDLIKQLYKVDTDITTDVFENKLLEINKQSNNSIYVIENAGEIIATAKLLVENKIFDSVGHIEDVVVDAEWRGLGLGKMLIEKLVEIAKESGCYKIVLSAKTDLTEFYIKCGFDNEGNLFTIRFD
jgi:dTDP-4-amino-4,6-dideoxygalactose transaminase/predicted GNAT family N-acyltransferase